MNVQFLKLSMDHQARASIDCLRLYLANLPSSIPLAEPTTSQYSFDAFAILPDEIKDFSEAGKGLEAVVDVLERYIEQLASSANPEVVLLTKWLEVLITTAENTFKSANIPVCH